MDEKTYTNDLSNEERETHFNMTGDDHSQWIIFTDDRYWVRRMERVGAELIAEVGKGRQYRLPANQVSVRVPPKPRKMTTEQKRKLVERLQAGRDAATEL